MPPIIPIWASSHPKLQTTRQKSLIPPHCKRYHFYSQILLPLGLAYSSTSSLQSPVPSPSPKCTGPSFKNRLPLPLPWLLLRLVFKLASSSSSTFNDSLGVCTGDLVAGVTGYEALVVGASDRKVVSLPGPGNCALILADIVFLVLPGWIVVLEVDFRRELEGSGKR